MIEYELNDIAEITSSKRIFYSDYIDNGIPFYRSREIINKDKGDDLKELIYISREKFETIKEKFGAPEPNDILLTSVGTIGNTYLVREGDEFYFKDGNLTWFRKWKGKAESRYVLYWIKSPLGQGKLYGELIGSSQKALTIAALKKIKINLPSLPTQQKIATILFAYDNLIENNFRRVKLLEEKAQLHYKELMQELSFSKNKREEYIKDCLAFYIGGGWGEDEYAEEFTEPAYVIRGTDLPDARKGEVKKLPFRYHKESNLASRKLQSGDIVFEVSGGSKDQPVGRSLLITEKMLSQRNPVMCASFCKMLRPNEKVSSEFFYLYLLAGYDNGVIAQYERHSASAIINYGFEEFIAEQKISLPSDKELKSFTEKVKPLFTLINTLGQQNSKLREARDILLPRLMNGEIEV